VEACNRCKIVMEVLRSCFLRIDSSLGSLGFEGVIVVLRGDPAHPHFRGVVIVFSFDFESLEVEGEFKPSLVKFLRMA
jgi:hypothetical protein